MRRSPFPLLSGLTPLLLATGLSSPTTAPAAAGTANARTIELEAVVEADAATLYRLWTTSAGARTLFPGADAVVGNAVGGEYRIVFDPGHPDGSVNGTAGCKIIELEPDRRVVFEWRGPAWAVEMNETPFPTWVEIDFEPVEGSAGVTEISLRHHGFGAGGNWDRSLEFFEAAWSRTLEGLQQRFAAQPELTPPAGRQPAQLYVFLLRPGPEWDPTKPLPEQARLFNHAAYLSSLAETGVMYLGGPFADISGESSGDLALGALRVPDLPTAERYLLADPAVQAGTFVYELRPWNTSLPEAR